MSFSETAFEEFISSSYESARSDYISSGDYLQLGEVVDQLSATSSEVEIELLMDCIGRATHHMYEEGYRDCIGLLKKLRIL